MKRLQALWTKNQSRLPAAEVLSPAQLQRVALRPPLTEIKHRLGKTSQYFILENWSCKDGASRTSPRKRSDRGVCIVSGHAGSSCVGRLVTPPLDSSSRNNQYSAPPGSYSWGVWADFGPLRNIGAYRMHDSFGNLLAYRLDILKDVVIKDSHQYLEDPFLSPSAAAEPRGGDTTHTTPRIEFLDMVVDCWLWPDEQGRVQGRHGGDKNNRNDVADESGVTVEDLSELEQLREQRQVLGVEDATLVTDTLEGILAEPQAVVMAIDAAIEEAKNNNSV